MPIETTIKEWIPSERQKAFIELPDSIFEALYGGAAGGGKTETLLMLPVVRGWIENGNFKGLILRRTFPELSQEVIPRSKKFYHACGGKYHDTYKRWTFPSGAVIQFGHCESLADARRYDSSEYNYVAFDELTSFMEDMYVYIAFTRVRSSDPTLPSVVRGGTNPGNVGHTWVFKRFVQPCITGYTVIRRTVKLNINDEVVTRAIDGMYIPSKATDNPYLMESDPNYLTRLASLPAAERAAKLEGKWDSYEGQVFEDFSHFTHVVKPFIVPAYWPAVLSIDWGYTAMLCAGVYRINPVPNDVYKAKIYKTFEYTCTKKMVVDWSADLKRMLTGIDFVDFVLCNSAWQERGQGLIADEVRKHFGRIPNRANNDRIGGKTLLQEYLRTTPRPPRYVPPEGFSLELALEIKRKQGDKAFEQYKQLFLPDPGEKYLPQFQIFDNCSKTIEVFPACTYASNDKGKPSEDVAEFKGDDPYDETRYGILACQRHLDMGKEMYAKAESEADAYNRLEQTKDMTAFYQRMDRLDIQFAKIARGVIYRGRLNGNIRRRY
jgi:hypothetical protein